MLNQLVMDDLRTLDILVTEKQTQFVWWPPRDNLEHIANLGIHKFNSNIYPNGYHYGNHTRVYVGKMDGIHVGFEWTYPKARFFEMQDWMLDPDYCRAFRPHAGEENQKWLNNAWLSSITVAKHLAKFSEGTDYDVLQLLGIALNAKWLQCSEENKVCSVGCLYITDVTLTGYWFDELPQWRTTPASFMNNPELYCELNKPRRMLAQQPLLPEPKKTEKVWYNPETVYFSKANQ